LSISNGLKTVKESPFNERLIKKGYEVLYLTEPVDEYAIQALPEFDGKRFQNVAKEGLDIDQSSKAKKQQEEYKEEFEPLLKWLKEKALKDKILEASITERLDKTPAALVASSYGWSGNMQRIMEAQAYKTRADSSQDFYAKQKKKMEINPRHPLIKQLNERIKNNEEDEEAIRNAQLMFDTAALRSDFGIADKVEFAERILNIMNANLGIDKDAEIEEEAADIDEDEEEEEEDDAEEIDADDDEDEEDEDIEAEEPVVEAEDDASDSFEDHDEL
jgi:heat shock protein beta